MYLGEKLCDGSVEVISSGVFVIAYFMSLNHRLLQEFQMKVKVMLRPTVSRPVGQSDLVPITHLGRKTRFLLLSDSCGFVDVGRHL
jgi:hypothetical protein